MNQNHVFYYKYRGEGEVRKVKRNVLQKKSVRFLQTDSLEDTLKSEKKIKECTAENFFQIFLQKMLKFLQEILIKKF